MVRKVCCVPGCKNNSENNPDLAYHHMPRTERIRNEWLTNIGTPELSVKPFSTLQRLQICSKHFTANQYQFPGSNKLNSGAVPTILAPLTLTLPAKLSALLREVIHNAEDIPAADLPGTSELSSEPPMASLLGEGLPSTSRLQNVPAIGNMAEELKSCPFENGINCKTVPEFENFMNNGPSNENDGNSRSSEENMRQFHVLDEINEDKNSDSDNGSDGSFSYDSDLPDEEIEAMLEEGLPEEFKNRKKRKLDNDGEEQKPYEERDKTVLIEKGQNHFDVLPEGWLQVSHNSGMPLYLHKTTRVCTLAKPYFLGPGSVRKHEIPLSAVPCLSYQRALEVEHVKPENPPPEQEVTSVGGLPLPNARIETVQENLETHSLTPAQVRDYCEKLFKFKTIKVMKFKSWSARRRFTKRKKHEKQLQRPTLPDGTKLITFPIQSTEQDSGGNQWPKKEWIMNPNGKSYVCILHEYVQHALKKQPSYKFVELENAATPYMATVSINDMQYGVGYGTSKKQAKSDAAKATLEILIPEMRAKITADEKAGGSTTSKLQDQDLSFFDEIKVEDPRVAEFCAKTTEPSPHAILLTCLQRNFGLGDMDIKYQGNTLKHQKNEFTMTVGKHTATVICKNKRDGKQRASQAILQALHPHITSWGSLLRLYGSRSVKSFKEKKQEEQEITLLQSKAAINLPNFAILDKLKLEMEKLGDSNIAIIPIGTFVPPDDVEIPILSSSNLNNVNL